MDKRHLDVIKTALNHYTSRLDALLKDEELLKNKPLELDIANTITAIKKAGESLELLYKRSSDDAFFNSFFRDFCKDVEHSLVIRPALQCYASDLKESMKLTKEKLGGIEPKFEEINKEIRLIDEIQRECYQTP